MCYPPTSPCSLSPLASSATKAQTRSTPATFSCHFKFYEQDSAPCLSTSNPHPLHKPSRPLYTHRLPRLTCHNLARACRNRHAPLSLTLSRPWPINPRTPSPRTQHRKPHPSDQHPPRKPLRLHPYHTSDRALNPHTPIHPPTHNGTRDTPTSTHAAVQKPAPTPAHTAPRSSREGAPCGTVTRTFG